MRKNSKFLTVPELNKIPWLVHGFGLAGFGLEGLADEPEFSSFQPVVLKQLHSSRVFCLYGKPVRQLAGDGLVTSAAGLMLIIRTADCLPIFLVDAENRAVAAVHCGWRSTAQKILAVTVDLMAKKFLSRPENLLAAFGPCIERNCYQVGPEVAEIFSRAGFDSGKILSPADRPGKFYLDLREANRSLLINQLGLRAENIHEIDLCTFCQPDLHSYRRERQTDRRLINFTGIRSRLI